MTIWVIEAQNHITDGQYGRDTRIPVGKKIIRCFKDDQQAHEYYQVLVSDWYSDYDIKIYKGEVERVDW